MPKEQPAAAGIAQMPLNAAASHPLRCICSISSISLASLMLTGNVVPGNSGRLGMATANTCRTIRPVGWG